MFEGIEDKFIVINRKRFDEIKNQDGTEDDSVINFYHGLLNFIEAYQKKTGKLLNQEYIVCNKDEPYAEKIWEIIKESETK